MHLRPTLALAALTLALAACQNNAPEPAPAAAPAPDATASTPPPPPPSLMRLRGNALMGKDGYGIVACGQETQQVAAFGPDAQAALDKFLAGGAKEFFIDGWGRTDAEGKPTFESFERLYTEGPGCDDRDVGNLIYALRGNEPFWAIDVTPQGIKLERPDHPAVEVAYAPFAVQGDVRRLEADAGGTPLVVEIAPGTCSDGMSDTVYGHTATVTLGAETLKGCAFAGLVSE
jgi:uncharacterized membrane protein